MACSMMYRGDVVPRILTPLLLPSRPREPLNSMTGAQLDSKSELTINHQLLSQEVISLKSWELSAWFPTPPPLPKSSQDLAINSTWCMPREPLYIGMLENVWKKENSLKSEKILLPLKWTTKKLELNPLKDNDKKKADLCQNIHYPHNFVGI